MAAPEQWWVLQETSGLPRDPGTIVYVAVSATSRAGAQKQGTLGNSVAAGPFKTSKDANNWIDKKTGLPKGTRPDLPTQTQHEKGPNPPNPLSGIEQVGHWLGELVSHLTDGPMWRSIAWILLGALFVFTGIVLWIKQNTGSLPAPLPVPV